MLVLIASLYRTPIQGEICWNWFLSKILSPNIGMLDYTLHMFSLAALQDVTLLAYFCPFMMLLALCIL